MFFFYFGLFHSSHLGIIVHCNLDNFNLPEQVKWHASATFPSHHFTNMNLQAVTCQ